MTKPSSLFNRQNDGKLSVEARYALLVLYALALLPGQINEYAERRWRSFREGVQDLSIRYASRAVKKAAKQLIAGRTPSLETKKAEDHRSQL